MEILTMGTVVLICAYLNESSSTFAHEMGHALNLPHTFDGDDPDNGLCGDDGIADTPPHIRHIQANNAFSFIGIC